MYRVCFVLGNYFGASQGGAELQAYFIANELITRGCEVHYVHRPCAGGNGSGSQLMLRDGEINLHTLRSHNMGKLGKLDALNYWELMGVLRAIDPDVVYQRCRTAHTGIVGRYAKLDRKRFIWATGSVHDCEKRTFGSMRADKAAVVAQAASYQLATYGMKWADKIIVQTADQAELLREHFGLESVTIPNSHPMPTEVLKKREPPVVAWVANLKRWKRPEVFLDLAERCTDLDAQFVMAGRTAGHRGDRALLRRADAMPNVDYRGELPLDETNALLAEASAFVNTSEPREGFPNTFIQAWMRAVPTVTLEFDPDGVVARKGLGFHSRTFEGLVRDVRRLVTDRVLREEYGRRALRHASENHDLCVVGPRYFRLLQELLGGEQ